MICAKRQSTEIIRSERLRAPRFYTWRGTHVFTSKLAVRSMNGSEEFVTRRRFYERSREFLSFFLLSRALLTRDARPIDDFLTDQISYHAERGEHAERHFIPVVSIPHVKIENCHFACERNRLDNTVRLLHNCCLCLD